jgi:hypothetical protein
MPGKGRGACLVAHAPRQGRASSVPGKKRRRAENARCLNQGHNWVYERQLDNTRGRQSGVNIACSTHVLNLARSRLAHRG